MPFGKGRRLFANGGRIRELWSGWQVQGICAFQSGQPLNWGNVLFTGNIKDIPLGDRDINRWFNTAAFIRTP